MVIAWQSPQPSSRRHIGHLDRGAAAVEMALVMPLLLAMLIGILDFSRIMNAELQLSQAAREGARMASLLPMSSATTIVTQADIDNVAAIQARARLAALNPAFGAELPLSGVVVVANYCTVNPLPTHVATVQVNYVFKGIFWLKNATLSQKAVMRCGG